MKKLSFVMLFLLVVMAGCSNYDTYIETGMQSLKDEKYAGSGAMKNAKKRFNTINAKTTKTPTTFFG
ncbi:hypothetical protein ACT7CZ_10165 [Bacillus cereus]